MGEETTNFTAACSQQEQKRPFEDLLRELHLVRHGHQKFTDSKTSIASKDSLSITSFGLATSRLVRVLSEPWVYTISRMLLQESPPRIQQLCHVYDMNGPTTAPDRAHWSITAVHQVYEPALLRIVCSLLRNQANVNGASNDRGRTPLMHCAIEGLQSVAAALLDARADVGAMDGVGRTALHHAVIQQDTSLVDLLMKFGADATARDDLGFQAVDIATIHGLSLHSLQVMDESQRKRSKKNDGNNEAPECISEKKHRVLRDACWTSNSFARDFVGIKRPALLRRAATHLIATEKWTRAELVKHAGESQVETGTIPYSDDFGGCDETIITTIGRFLEVEIDLFAPSGVPYYLFEFVDCKLHPSLFHFIHAELGGLPDHLPPPFHDFKACALQFAVGCKGSGSPAHFHDDAFNILIAGCKQWWLWPPSHASMSRIHPSKLVGNIDVDISHCLQAIQMPGDIVYVPNGWGHAVLNVADDTVSVAVEFEA